ncbi:MAG: hypothetical protein ACRD3Q_22190, partial [Terriglobales bacterium]
APLSLGIDSVESERGFAGAAEAGDDRQRISRDFNVNVFEVVLARAPNRDLTDSHLEIWKSGNLENGRPGEMNRRSIAR